MPKKSMPRVGSLLPGRGEEEGMYICKWQEEKREEEEGRRRRSRGKKEEEEGAENTKRYYILGMVRWGGGPQPGRASTTPPPPFVDGDEEVTGVRPPPTRFSDTTNTTTDFGPVPVAPPPGGRFHTAAADRGPIFVGPGNGFETAQFDPPPVPVPDGNRNNNNNNNNSYFPGNGGETPFAIVDGQKPEVAPDGPASAPPALVLADAILRPATVVALVIALALLCTQNNFQASPTTKYLLAAVVMSLTYEIYETIIAVGRLATGRHLVPASTTLYVSYILDQICLALLLTAGAASAAFFKDLEVKSECDLYTTFCTQTITSTSLTFISALLLAASSVISSFCFFKNKV